MKQLCEPVAINVGTNTKRGVGTHEVGLAQTAASASIKVMQKVRGVVSKWSSGATSGFRGMYACTN